MRREVRISMGVNEKVAAQTGRPHWAISRLMPTVRRKVVLPDMLDPVTRMRRSSRPMVKSLAMRLAAGMRGWAKRVDSMKRAGAQLAGAEAGRAPGTTGEG